VFMALAEVGNGSKRFDLAGGACDMEIWTNDAVLQAARIMELTPLCEAQDVRWAKLIAKIGRFASRSPRNAAFAFT